MLPDDIPGGEEASPTPAPRGPASRRDGPHPCHGEMMAWDPDADHRRLEAQWREAMEWSPPGWAWALAAGMAAVVVAAVMAVAT